MSTLPTQYVIYYVKVVLRWKNCSWFFLHNLKDIIVISNCAKFHPKIRWNKGSNLRVKFVFYTAAIKVAECEKNVSRRALTSTRHRLNKNNDLLLTTTTIPFCCYWGYDITTSPRLILPSSAIFNESSVKYKLHTYITAFISTNFGMKLCTVTNYYNIFTIM